MYNINTIWTFQFILVLAINKKKMQVFMTLMHRQHGSSTKSRTLLGQQEWTL